MPWHEISREQFDRMVRVKGVKRVAHGRMITGWPFTEYGVTDERDASLRTEQHPEGRVKYFAWLD